MSKKNVAWLGVFLGLALILSFVESLIPFTFAVPGIKLGLTNIVVVFMLYTITARQALLVSVLRAVLAGFLFGNVFSIIYSLAGVLLSFLVMYLLKRTGKLNVISISTAGGICHNLGQILLAMVVVRTYQVIYYFPVLMVAGLITGLIIGVVAGIIIKRVGIYVK